MQCRIQIFSCRFHADPPYSFFVGLRRINSNNTNDAFQWIDGTLLSSGSGYSNWRSGEPNNQGGPPSGEDCVTMGFQSFFEPAYNWIDGSCADSLLGNRYICESNINGEQQRVLIIGSVELWFEAVAV